MAQKKRAKTPEQKKAIRQEGWKEAKEALIDRGKNALANAKATKSLFDAAVDFKSGKYISGITKAVSAVPAKVKQGINTYRLTKGVIKGIFNDDSFWNQLGFTPELVVNEHRVMDPAATAMFSPDFKSMGVGNLIDTNFKFADISESEAFNFAITEAWQILRIVLKSNLPYTKNWFKAYVLEGIELQLCAFQLSRNINWATYTRSDVPTISEQLKYVVPKSASGLSPVQALPCISDDTAYAGSISSETRLSNLLKLVVLPDKLIDFAYWLGGTMFVDQAAPNPQIYRTNFVDIPHHVYQQADDSIVTVASVDATQLTVDKLLSWTSEFLDRYSLPNADIAKTEGYSPCRYIPYATDHQLKWDDEYFNMLINAYSYEPVPARKGYRDEFYRIDIMDALPENKNCTTINAIGAILASNPGCVSVVNQGIILKLSDQNYIDAGAVVSKESSSVTVGPKLAKAGYYCVASSSKATKRYIVRNVSSGTSTDIVKVEENSFLDQIFNTSKLQTIALKSLTQKFTVFPYGFKEGVGGAMIDTGWHVFRYFAYRSSDNVTKSHDLILDVKLNRTSVNPANFTIDSAAIYSIDGAWMDTYRQTCVKVANLTVDPDNGLSIHEVIDKDNITLKFAGKYLLENANISYSTLWAQYFLEENTPLVDWEWIDYVELGFSRTSEPYKFAEIKTSYPEYLAEVIDYHIPFVVSESLEYYNTISGTSTITKLTTTETLLKECYIPTVISKTEIERTLYNMYASLFRIRNIDSVSVMKK